MRLRKTRYADVAAYGCIALCALVLVFRAFYGFDWTDESFYLSTAYRVMQGDALLAHEWHPTQLFVVLTMPLLKLYCAIQGSTDGCVLFFRIAYVAFSTIAATTFFFMMSKDFNKLYVLIAALALQMYNKSGIPSLSYYTIVLVSFTGFCLCLYRYAQIRRRRYAVASGILYAVSTLCIPYLAVAFALGAMAVTILCFARKCAVRSEVMRFFGWMMAGLLLVFAVFCAFFLMTVPLGDFLYSLPSVFLDPTHVRGTYLTDTVLQFARLVVGTSRMTLAGLALIAAFVMIVRRMGRKMGRRMRTVLFIVSVALVLGVIMLAHADYLVLALVLLGLIAYFMTDARNTLLMRTLYMPGFALSVTCFFSSNTGVTAIAVGLLPTLLASLLMIGRFLDERLTGAVFEREKPPLRVASLVLCVAVVLTCGYRRVVIVYRDAPLDQLRTKIEQGPAAGLSTSADRALNYEKILRTVRQYAVVEGTMLEMPFVPWAYLCTDMRCACPTTWRMYADDFRFQRYYSRYPDRFPRVLFALDPAMVQYGSTDKRRTGALLEKGSFFADVLERTNFDRIDTDCGTVYVRQ